VLGALAFAAGVAGGVQLVRLDGVVRERFAGNLFQVPTRVYSAPTVLFPGLDAERLELENLLVRLGYQRLEDGSARLAPGRFVRAGSRLQVHLRALEHPVHEAPARELRIAFREGRIEELRDVATGRELGAVLLEPEPIGAFYGPGREQRALVRLDHVPDHLVHAILAVEDQRFATHHGIDPIRIAGAAWANLRSGAIRQGGSTLTQQLVKNFFLTPERTLRRKLQEAAMAVIIEARYAKSQILEAYLNEIYLGQRGSTAVHGVGEASRVYFGKTVPELELSESALLAAIIHSPNATSPYDEPERALRRRNLVLYMMREQGRIEEAAYEIARAEPIRTSHVTPDPGEARYFLDVLRRQLPEVYDAASLASEGLRVYSSLDPRMQRIGARALREGLEELERRNPKLRGQDGGRLEGCLVALRPQTGEVLALVGGRDYGTSQFDRCTQARRPAGSVFKPFVYAAALEPGAGGPAITLASWLDDSPLAVSTPAGPWRPSNYDGEHHGPVGVREAFEGSLNVATARLGQEVGLRRVAEMARRLGIESPLPIVPSLAIGSADVSPLEIARAYATLANGGVRPVIRSFEELVDREGRTLERRPIEFERVLDPGTAFLVGSLMQGVVDRGTGSQVRASGLRGPIAGKTGTSPDWRDAWFVGFTPELVAVVWVGFDEPRSLGLTGSGAALPVWIRFVRETLGTEIRGAFLPPSQVVRLDVDPHTGARALPGCPVRRSELFLAGTEPTATCPEERVAGRDGEPPAVRRFFDWLVEGWLGGDL
jgi:penicillin-binding protein 1B